MTMQEIAKLTIFVIAFLMYTGKESSLASFTPIDNYLVACGSSNNITFQGQIFIPDSQHSQLEIIANKSIAITSKHNVPSPLYKSARIFSENASYIFRIKQYGRHWIRLYLRPFPDSNHNMSFASITVVTDSSVLLNNFTFINDSDHLFKEYAISVTSSKFSLTFIPRHDSIVFVNAIQVVSIPDVLFPHNLDSYFATETLGRIWESDETYFHSASIAINISRDISAMKDPDFIPIIAPALVYATAKAIGSASEGSQLSWEFHVSRNFLHFVRVHFCYVTGKSRNSVVLNLYMNGNITFRNLDMSTLFGDFAETYYKDFVFIATQDTLKVSVDPTETINGLEIMKISNRDGSLDSFSSVDIVFPKSSERSKKQKSVIIIGCSFFVLMILVFLGLSFCCLKLRRQKKKSATASKFVRHFTLQAIQKASNGFDPNLVIGEGGFGKVFKGTLENGKTVAIKVANQESRQGFNEFQNEIELLSGLQHQNLVSLVGCCSEDSELILVYNYMANGSLSSHLYGREFIPLSWKKRLTICLGAAKGLCYLHIGAKQSVIHRDVKASNILLDENLVSKVADFGISKKGPLLDKSHVTTNVKGSFGYVDPEYFRTKYLTKKSDVYSFGVVLIEVICGKPALDDARPTQQMNLALWALSCNKNGTFHEMLDPYLIGKVNMDSVNKVIELAWKCLEEHRVNRPPMGYVLCELEEALHLELAAAQVFTENLPLKTCDAAFTTSIHANVKNGVTDYIEDIA